MRSPLTSPTMGPDWRSRSAPGNSSTTGWDKILYPALRVLTESPAPFTRALDDHVDATFFERLFADVDQDPATATRDFTARVLALAREVLSEAIESVPLPTAQRYRAITAAERIFAGAAHKRFPDVYAVKGEPSMIEVSPP